MSIEKDEGSTLGRLFVKLAKGNKRLADVLLRAFVGLLVGLSLIPLVKHDVDAFVIYLIGITGSFAFIRWLAVEVRK